MPVSAASADKPRAAMARLLAGEPVHTDGALTKEKLAREAQVSHATITAPKTSSPNGMRRSC